MLERSQLNLYTFFKKDHELKYVHFLLGHCVRGEVLMVIVKIFGSSDSTMN